MFKMSSLAPYYTSNIVLQLLCRNDNHILLATSFKVMKYIDIWAILLFRG